MQIACDHSVRRSHPVEFIPASWLGSGHEISHLSDCTKSSMVVASRGSGELVDIRV